jgi:drug/metabolite transporter (DMT)-like permease
MTWVLLSLLGAFGQALGWALKKKTLENQGINNLLGVISYAVAGLLLVLFWGIPNSFVVPKINLSFIEAAAVVISLNVVALWAAYKAVDKVALSKLMPFMAFTCITMVPVEYMLRNVLPNSLQIVGMVVVITGATLFSARERPDKTTLHTAGYFLITLVCYSVVSPYMAVMIDEVGSGLFSGAVTHFGISIGFLFILLSSAKIEFLLTARLIKNGTWKKLLMYMIASGVVMAFLENGPINLALEQANASEVFALKRTMPFFSLILGICMFSEKVTIRHWIGTILLVIGSALVMFFK